MECEVCSTKILGYEMKNFGGRCRRHRIMVKKEITEQDVNVFSDWKSKEFGKFILQEINRTDINLDNLWKKFKKEI